MPLFYLAKWNAWYIITPKHTYSGHGVYKTATRNTLWNAAMKRKYSDAKCFPLIYSSVSNTRSSAQLGMLATFSYKTWTLLQISVHPVTSRQQALKNHGTKRFSRHKKLGLKIPSHCETCVVDGKTRLTIFIQIDWLSKA